MLLALGRSNPLKNLPLTLDAWRRLPHPRPELCLFGTEPELASEPGIRYVTAPSDREVNKLLNQATVFLQTSTHEGFCLTVLEAMATGGAVVCTDAHGNRDFCADGENCLMPEARRRRGRRCDQPAARRSGASLAPRSGRASPRRAPMTGIRASTRWSASCSRSPDRGGSRPPPTRCPAPRRRYRSSATRGAIRLNTQKPTTKIATMIATGSSSAAVEPSSAAALGVAWVMNAWRNCWKITASGLSM